MVAGMVVHAGEGLEVEEGALVGDGVSEVVREEEIGVFGTDLVSDCGSVLARRWSVVGSGCRWWCRSCVVFLGMNDGGNECIVDHLVGLV